MYPPGPSRPGNPQQLSYFPGSPSDQPVFGMSNTDMAYAALLLMADILAFLGFLVITSSGVDVEGALGHVSIHYGDSHALQFAVVVAVGVWVWTLVLIVVLVLVQLMDAWSPSPVVVRAMGRANAVACLFSYSAAVVTSAVSSNCKSGNASTFYLYSDDTVKGDVASFCNQVCTRRVARAALFSRDRNLPCAPPL